MVIIHISDLVQMSAFIHKDGGATINLRGDPDVE